MSNETWYSTGAEAAERLAATSGHKKSKNFFTKAGETARIRFLSPAAESFNYKRAFVSWAKGPKLLTSPGTVPDPFIERGLQLQTAFAWPIIDRRVFEFDDKETNEKKSVGPRILFFADGIRTRKQLVSFEKEMLASTNEDRVEEGLEPLELKDFNLSHYDVKATKEKGAPWLFVAMKAKALTKADEELAEKYEMDLAKELAPLPQAELAALLRNPGEAPAASNGEGASDYSYEDGDDDVVKFDD